MTRQAKKAPKGDDAFQQRKQKVGRKKLAPATATRAEVSARTLRINNAVPTKDTGAASVGDDGVILCRDLSENVVATEHYKANVRANALGSLCAEVGERATSLSSVVRLRVLAAALSRIADSESDVRDRAVSLLDAILRHSAPDPSIVRTVVLHVRVALTHAVFGVRMAGLETTQALLLRWPGSLGSAVANHTETFQMLERLLEIATATRQPRLSVVADLLSELLESDCAFRVDGSCRGFVLAFLEKALPVLQVKWKELMEMRYALFRDPAMVAQALAVGKIFAVAGLYCRLSGGIPPATLRCLREMLLFRIPFTMGDLCATGSHPRSLELAAVIACGCAPLVGTPSSSDALRCTTTYLSTAFSNQANPTEVLKLLSILAHASQRPVHLPFLQPAMQMFCRSAALEGSVIVSFGGLLQDVCTSRCDLDQVELQQVAAAFNMIPRLLFACRRKRRDEATAIALTYLSIVHDAVALRHPLLSYVDASFNEQLQSLFSVADSVNQQATKGIVEAVDQPAVSRLAVSIFYYLGTSPQTTIDALPACCSTGVSSL